MKQKTIYVVFLVIALLFLFGVVRQCTQIKQIKQVTVVIPEKKGSFEKPTKVDTFTRKPDTIYLQGKEIYTQNPVNKELVRKYLESQDTLGKLKLYLKAIEEVEQTSTFDDEDINLKVYTKTRGTLLNIKPTYTIKEKEVKVDVPVKVPVFTLYGGGDVIVNNNNFALKVDLGIQNKKGTIFNLGVDNNKNYYVGAKFKIFNIKK